MNNNKFFSVLTGDIVASSMLSEKLRRELPKKLTDILLEAGKIFNDFKYKPILFRGDSWQMLLNSPEKSLRIAMFIRAKLKYLMDSKKIDTRVSIAIDSIDFIPENDISIADGNAFRLSGKALENIGKEKCFVFNSGILNNDINLLINGLLNSSDYLLKNLTVKQCKTLTGALQNMKQKEIANLIWKEKEISQQAIAQHLASSGWSVMANNLNIYEKIVTKYLEKYING